MMELILSIIQASWDLLLEASIYILFGIIIGGLLKVFLNPDTIARHLGKGKFSSVIKSAFFGIPIPLCSCGVLPAAASLKKQGANNGAVTSFLISTPESGVDSIAVSYALLDPIMTVARPITAFFTAVIAGITENIFDYNEKEAKEIKADSSCPVDNCCNGVDCPPEIHKHHHSLWEKLISGLKFSFTDIWGELANWFFVGLIIGGIITALIPEELLSRYLGGGIYSMLIMLVVGIPLYICATASTPVAAALILKGVSPGAALVFLLVGPATNAASISVLFGLLGKRATAIYLISLSVMAVIFGLLIDQIYLGLGITAQAVTGQAAEVIPHWLQMAGAIVLVLISIKPVSRQLKAIIFRTGDSCCSDSGCESDSSDKAKTVSSCCSSEHSHNHSHVKKEAVNCCSGSTVRTSDTSDCCSAETGDLKKLDKQTSTENNKLFNTSFKKASTNILLKANEIKKEQSCCAGKDSQHNNLSCGCGH